VSFDQESTAEIEYEVMFEVSIGNPLHPGPTRGDHANAWLGHRQAWL